MILARRCLAGCARSGGVPGSAPGLGPIRTPGAGPPSVRPTVSSAAVSQLRRQPGPFFWAPSARTIIPPQAHLYGCRYHVRLPGIRKERRQPYVTAATSGWGCSQLPVLVRRSGGAIVSSPFSRRPRQAPRCLRGALVPRRAILTLLWTAFATGGGPRGLPGTNGTYGGQHRASTGQSRAEQSHPSAQYSAGSGGAGWLAARMGDPGMGDPGRGVVVLARSPA